MNQAVSGLIERKELSFEIGFDTKLSPEVVELVREPETMKTLPFTFDDVLVLVPLDFAITPELEKSTYLSALIKESAGCVHDVPQENAQQPEFAALFRLVKTQSSIVGWVKREKSQILRVAVFGGIVHRPQR